MCQELGRLEVALAGVAAGFDAGLLSGDDARVVLGQVTALANMAATLQALVAARVAEVGRWRDRGERSAAHDVARATGISVRDAQGLLGVGRGLLDRPEVAGAARRGELSAGQTSVIVDAGPAAGPRLVAQARGTMLGELLAAAAVAAGAEDLEAGRARVGARRRLRQWTDGCGEWHLAAHGNPECGAQVMAALAPLIDEQFVRARAGGRHEPVEAYAFDALVQLCTEAASIDPATADGATTHGAAAADGASTPARPAPGDPVPAGNGRRRRRRRGAPVKLLLRVDLDTFVRGFPVDGETCELVGYGPVAMSAMSAVRDLLDLGDPFVAAILTRGQALVGVAHLGRQPTAHQRSALEWLFPSCTVSGCPAQHHLEIDHRVDWADTHFTMIGLLDGFCPHHHMLKTRNNWALVEGTGKRAFVPPTDPRHPNYRE